MSVRQSKSGGIIIALSVHLETRMPGQESNNNCCPKPDPPVNPRSDTPNAQIEYPFLFVLSSKEIRDGISPPPHSRIFALFSYSSPLYLCGRWWRRQQGYYSPGCSAMRRSGGAIFTKLPSVVEKGANFWLLSLDTN